MDPSPSARLSTLDALRGTGSLAVVLYHLGFAVTLAGNGYLAVDFFFFMSGVVITRAYQPRMAQGMDAIDFMAERVIRFAPFYLLALGLGFGRKVLQILVDHPQAMAWPDLLLGALSNALMLPSPTTRELTPLNVVTWSLQLELLINAVWAVVLVRLSRRRLLVLLAALAVVLCALVVARGSSAGGAEWKDLHMGLARGSFGFVAGMALARCLAPRPPRESTLAVAAVALLLGLLVVDVAPGRRAVHDLFSIFVCFPVVMVLALRFDPPRGLKGVARWLGDVSFPVYALHFGVLHAFLYLAGRWGFAAGTAPGVWIAVFVVVVLGLSIVLARTFDPAARRCLRGFWRRRRARLARAA